MVQSPLRNESHWFNVTVAVLVFPEVLANEPSHVPPSDGPDGVVGIPRPPSTHALANAVNRTATINRCLTDRTGGFLRKPTLNPYGVVALVHERWAEGSPTPARVESRLDAPSLDAE